MGSVDLESLVADLRESNRALQEQMQALSARLPPVVETDEMLGKEFPRLLYKAGHKKGQIDHPGNLTKKVKTAHALEVALADGWQLDPLPFDYEAEPTAPVKKAAGKGEKK